MFRIHQLATATRDADLIHSIVRDPEQTTRPLMKIDLDSFELHLLHMVQWYETDSCHRSYSEHESQFPMTDPVRHFCHSHCATTEQREETMTIWSVLIANRISSSNGVYLIAINLHIVNTARTRTRSNRSASDSGSRATINCCLVKSCARTIKATVRWYETLINNWK